MKTLPTHGTSPSKPMRNLIHATTSWIVLTTALAACTQDRALTETTVTRLGVQGGRAVSPDGLFELSIPPGALAADLDVLISVDRTTLDGENLTPIYVLGPDTLALTADARIQIAARGELGEHDADIADLSGGTVRFLDGDLDESAFILTATTRRTSSYVARRRPSRCIGLSCGDNCSTGLVQRACNARGRCVLATRPLGCGFDGGIVDGGPGPADGGPGPADGGPALIDAGPLVPDAGPTALDGGPSGVLTESEPNDDRATANSIPANGTVVATSPGGDADFFAVDLATAGWITAYTYTQLGAPATCQGIDTVIAVFNASGGLVMTNDDRSGQDGCSEVSGPLPAGRHYLSVRAFNAGSSTTAYFLDVVFAPGASPPDAGLWPDATTDAPDGAVGPIDAGSGPGDAGGLRNGWEMEPNDDELTANLLSWPSSTVEAYLEDPDGAPDVDVFAIDLPVPATLIARTYNTLNTPGECILDFDSVLTIYSATSTVPVAQNDDAHPGTDCSYAEAPVAAGRYYVWVVKFVAEFSWSHYHLDVFTR